VQATYYSSLQPLVYALRRQTPPANDNFADRISLRGRSVKITGSNIGATREAEDFAAVRTVWWSWRSPANGVATFLVNPNPGLYDSFLGRLAVFTGDELPTLALLGERSVVAIPVEAGRDYQIAVGNLPSAYSGTFELQIIFDPGPSNDAFADRKPLDVFAVGSLLGSTIEPDEPAIAAGLGSVWWSWTPRTTGVYELRLDLLEGLLPFYINGWELYAGDALNELEPVETHGPTWTRYRVEAGVRYAVRVTGRPGISKFRLRAEFQAPPENDSFARRIVLRGPNATSTGSTANATAEPDELSHSSPNAWWTWTAPGKGAARVTIDDPYCHGIVVHTGNRLTNLSSIVESYEPTGATFLTEPGRAYQIEVRGESCGYSRATFDLSLKFYPTPANDDFADRILLAGTNVTMTNAVLLGSRMEEGEPRVALNGLFSVWWQWTAPQTGRYVFEPLPGDIPVTFVLFTGTNLATLTQVAASEWSSSPVNVALAEGTSLAIVAQSEAGFPRERFRWRIRLTTAPANDDFAGRIEIDGPNMQGTLEGSTLDVGDPLFLASSSIWWSLTPTNSGWREILVAAVPYGNADFRVFRGTNLEDLRMISPRGVRSSPFPYFWMEAGESYAIEVAGFGGWFGPVNLAVRFFTTATNDWFANAIVIPSGGGVLVEVDGTRHRRLLLYSRQQLAVWLYRHLYRDGVVRSHPRAGGLSGSTERGLFVSGG
jgi:hypothetical protein